jgi:pilus assembly protein CpaF
MAPPYPDNGQNGAPSPSGTRNGPSARAEPTSPDAHGQNAGQVELRLRFHRLLLSTLPSDRAKGSSEKELRSELERSAVELSRKHPELDGFSDHESLVQEVLEDVLGYGPIAGLMRDDEITEILINGPLQLFLEKRGQLFTSDITFRDESHLLHVVRRMIAQCGKQLDKRSPMVDARLPDGSRLNVVLRPPALNGPLVSIRRFGVRPLTIDDLMTNASLVSEMVDFLAACVRAKVSMIISGGTGSGKTTLLNALSRFIPGTERLVTIEDTAELELQQPHVAKMESQLADRSGEGGVSLGDLVKNSLRMRPDRIIVGECRGAEALEMLHAMNTGHEGSMTTVHANSTREALSRVELMVGLSGIDIPQRAIRRLIATSVSLVIQVTRLPGGPRKVVTISEITGVEGEVILMHDLFGFVQTGVNLQGDAEGYFRATGIRPHLLNKLKIRGENLPPELFFERQLQPRKNRETVR